MKIIFCGGGTAGHITPAIAIAQEIKKRNKENQILFIGRDGGNENDLITKAGFPLTTLTVAGIKRKATVKNVDVILKALKAKKEAKRIIKAFSPNVILGTGGYVCWPVIKAGYEMKIPVFIHESNIYPGLTTKLLANKCEKVLLSNEDTIKFLPRKAKASVVGNPVNREFFTTKRAAARAKLDLSTDDIFILSFGGSLGAQKLNDTIISLMKNYSSKNKRICHLHATGKSNYTSKMQDMFSKKSRCKIAPFIDDMPLYMKSADIVICRAGAMTITELAAAKSAAILIPSPNVTANHQLKNANALGEKNAAIVIAEEDLTEDVLAEKIECLVANEEERINLSKCIELFAKKNVENAIIEEIYSAVNYSQKTTK